MFLSCFPLQRNSAAEDKADVSAPNGSTGNIQSTEKEHAKSSSSNLVFGYLNLFSDGVV